MLCDAATAQAVDSHCRGFLRQATLDAGDAREIHVFGFAVDHVAEDELANQFGIDLGAADRFLDDLTCEFRRGDVLECAAVIADCSAHAAQNDNFASVIHGDLRN